MIESSKQQEENRILNYGMVGGGEGSFIGDVHRKAATFDGYCQLVAGCFSRSYDNTIRTGRSFGIREERLYHSYEEMAEAEGKRADGIDFVSIVTTNATHYEIAKAFLNQGIHVSCEKPLCFSIEEAEELRALAKLKGLLFMVTYAYSGYPMIEEARQIVKSGKIGEIRTIMAEYPQDWLTNMLEETDNRQAQWRTDPAVAGISNCVGDIGSHIENTVSYITGLKIKRLCARLEKIPETRPLDTNAHVMVEYDNGASGVYWSSQIAVGHENDLEVRIYGTKGSVRWSQLDINSLKVSYIGEPIQTLTRGQSYLSSQTQRLTRTPSGHPEGYYEAFANMYMKFSIALVNLLEGKDKGTDELCFTDVEDGYEGVKYIHKCVESSEKGTVWVDLD